MTKRERLQEQYEDALFALLIDNIAKLEGKRLLEENERLKSDLSAEVPATSVRRCQRFINREFSKRYARTLYHSWVRMFNKIAPAAFAAVLLFTGAFAASETVRTSTLNLIIELSDTYIDYRFGEPPMPESSSDFDIGWVPEGFVLTEKDSDRYATQVCFEGPHDEILEITLYNLGKSGVISIDTEDAVIENTTINGWDTTLVMKDYIQIAIPVPEREQFLTVVCFADADYLSKDYLLRVVENITLMNKYDFKGES